MSMHTTRWLGRSPLALAVCLVAVLGAFGSDIAVAQTRPALVKDVENPSQSPYWSAGYDSNDSGMVNFFVTLGKVPAGKRLTLEFVSIRCVTPADDSIYDVRISVSRLPGTTYEYPILVTRQGTNAMGHATWVASQPVRLYLDNLPLDPSIYVNVFHKNWSDPDGSTTCVVDLSGSLVSVQ